MKLGFSLVQLARRAASRTFDGIVSVVLDHGAPNFGTFLVVKTKKEEDGDLTSVVSALDSVTLEDRVIDGETKLPGGSSGKDYGTACISPCRSLLCAIPYSQLNDRPVIAAVPCEMNGFAKPVSLGNALALAVVRQVDSSDLVGRVVGLDDDDLSIVIMRTLRDTLQGMLRTGQPLVETPFELERLGVVASVYRASKNLAVRGRIAYDICQFAACVRAFVRCEKKSRGALGLGYECESDAIWPLIGHLTWYCDFARELVREVNASQSLNIGVPLSPHSLMLPLTGS
ncbi:hypothetical protein P7C70_g9237, partial [Phenoliferia sp. Uapishka_3]